jgi:oxaloacetate decarboxylase gamma subunit
LLFCCVLYPRMILIHNEIFEEFTMETESVSSLLLEAGSLMLIGMVFVFSFLALLIVGIHLIAKFCEAFPGEAAPQYAAPRRKAVQAGVDGNVVAAITAAVHTHRQANKN